MGVSKIAGIKPSDIELKVLRDSERPILPATRDRILIIPGRHGARDFGADLEPKYFNLDCAFLTRSPKDLQSHAETLAQLLIDGYGKPRTVEMILSANPDRAYQVRYSGSLPISRLVGMGRFTLPLIAFDPFAYWIINAGDVILDSDILLDTDIRLGDEYSFPITSPKTVEVNNIGSMNAEPLIEVDGSFATLTIEAGGEIFNYTQAHAGGVIAIDSQRMTVKVGSTNKLSAMTGNFPILLHGINEVNISGTALNCTISFIFKPKFI